VFVVDWSPAKLFTVSPRFVTVWFVSFSCDMLTASLSFTPRATLVIFVPPVFVVELYVSPPSVTELWVLLSYITASATDAAVADFSWLTFTASVSAAPAARLVMRRSAPADPTDTSPTGAVPAIVPVPGL